MIADEAETPLRMEALAVIGHDAGRLLTAMLQSVQPERGQRRGVVMAENTENAALFAQPVFLDEGRHLPTPLNSNPGAGSCVTGRSCSDPLAPNPCLRDPAAQPPPHPCSR